MKGRTRVDILIEPYGIQTTVVVFPPGFAKDS